MPLDTARNELDLSAWWMPFTANRQFKTAPRLFASASGMTYRMADGQAVIDGTAGLWCVNAGHGRPEIADAVHRQLMELDYAPPFQMGHSLAFELASRLAKLAPAGLDRVFFTNSGSESVETALKIAFAYHRAKGEAQRIHLVGRERGYHGVNFGGMSVGGLVNNRRMFPTLPYVHHLSQTHLPQQNSFSVGLPDHGADLADELEQLAWLHGGETIAAVIVEPVAGSGGVLPPPKGYLERLRAICDKHGILLIFDEVITGYGRLGTPFGAQRLGVTPDIMTTAKGVTNGVVPMGAVFASRKIHDAFMQGPPAAIEFFHGYTYSGHPVACAAALAALDIYEREGLLTRVLEIEDAFAAGIHSVRGSPHVTDIRNFGLMGAIDLAPRPGAPGARGYAALLGGLANGLLLRASGDTLAFSPPLIVSADQIGEIFAIVGKVLKTIE